MLQLYRSNERWWQKPLGELSGKILPVELLVLRVELGESEDGVWLNSRGAKSGVIDLVRKVDGKFKTVRRSLPNFVSDALTSIYKVMKNKKGATDLAIWHESSLQVRFVEVKCPHWCYFQHYLFEFLMESP